MMPCRCPFFGATDDAWSCKACEKRHTKPGKWGTDQGPCPRCCTCPTCTLDMAHHLGDDGYALASCAGREVAEWIEALDPHGLHCDGSRAKFGVTPAHALAYTPLPIQGHYQGTPFIFPPAPDFIRGFRHALLANNKWLVARFGPRVLSDVKIVHTGGVLVGAPHNDGPDAAVVCVLTVSGTRQLYHGEKKTPYLSPGKHTKLDAQLEHACTPSMGHMWIGSGATRHGTKYTSATTVSVIFRTPPDQALSRDPVEGFMWTQGQFIFPTLLQVQSAMDQVEKCQLDQARSWGLGPPRMVIDDDVDGMDDDEEAKDRG